MSYLTVGIYDSWTVSPLIVGIKDTLTVSYMYLIVYLHDT